MPKHEQTIALNNTDKETAFAIAYQAMKNSGWMVQFAGPDKLLGSTPKNWKNNPLQILITIAEGNLTVSSEMVSGESFDMMGKNKKTTAAFLTAFDEALKSTNESTIESNKHAINTLREATIKTAEQEAQQAAEVDKAMNLSGSNLYVTYGIIAINILVFILMAFDGAGIFATDGLVHIKWGSNYGELTLSGDWWRLITSVFIHFGIIHLLMNMYCLYMIGIYLEPMLGKVKYIAAYLCTGILANIVSLWWHNDIVNGAGASGAIFGLYGLFLALLTTNLIPKHVRQSLLQSIGIFIAYNLLYGLKPGKGGVDNSAHIGGLISGFVIGYIYVFGIKKEKQEQKVQWIVPVIVLLTIGGAYGYLNQNVVSAEQRKAQLSIVDSQSFKDYDKFNDKLQEFDKIRAEEINITGDTAITEEERVKKIDEIGLPKWQQAEQIINSTKTLDISVVSHNKGDKILDYIRLHKEEQTLIKKMVETNQMEQLMPQLNDIRIKAKELFNEILKM